MKTTSAASHKALRLFSLLLSLMILVTAILPTQAQAAETDDAYVRLRNEWNRHDRKGTLWIEYNIHKETYYHYADLDRTWGIERLVDYANDSVNRELVSGIVWECFAPMTDFTDFSRDQIVNEMVQFVQKEITYVTDMDAYGLSDYPQYPIETLYKGQGDCEDSGILLASMLREYGYNVALIHVPGHIAVGIRTDDDYEAGPYYQTQMGRYLFIESTCDGFKIGQIPDEYMTCSARFLWL